jgi:hypothetical protein
MALDFMSKVITTFKADTSDLKSKLKDLQDEEKKLAKTQLEAAEQRNKSYDDWLKRMANINQSIELAGRAIGFAKDAFKTYAEDLRLKAAAGSVSIDKLKAASLGLREETDLLRFAAQTQNGVFKLTEDQMVTAQKAMVALTRAGYDQEEVTQKVTDALVKGKAKGLDAFGMSVQKGKTDVEDFNNLMGALALKAQGVEQGTGDAGESVQAMGVQMADAFDSMKASIGQLVMAMAPLLSALAKAVSLIAEATQAAIDIAAGRNKGAYQIINEQKGLGVDSRIAGNPIAFGMAHQTGVGLITKEQQAYLDVLKNMAELGDRIRGQRGLEEFTRLGAAPKTVDAWDAASSLDEATFYTFAERFKQKDKKKGSGAGGGGPFSRYASYAGSDSQTGPASFSSSLGSVADTTQYDEFGRAMEFDLEAQLKKNYEALTQDWQTKVAEQQGKRTSFLESTFGTIEEFNAYNEAFQLLTGSVSSGLNAWIDGSMSAGVAVKKFLADAIKGLASQMAVESLKHGAYAIGSAAFGDYRGAGQHAAASAAFGAGAAAAAVAAKSLGVSASVPSAGAGGGASGGSRGASGSAGGSSSGDSSGKPVVIVLGNHFDELSPRQRAIHAREGFDRAMRERDE